MYLGLMTHINNTPSLIQVQGIEENSIKYSIPVTISDKKIDYLQSISTNGDLLFVALEHTNPFFEYALINLSKRKVIKYYQFPGVVIFPPFSPDSKYIAISFNDISGSYIKIMNTEKGKEIVNKTLDYSVISDVVFSHDGKYIASVALNSVIIYDTVHGKKFNELYNQSHGYATKAKFSPDDKYLAVSFGDETIKIYDINKNQQINSLGQANNIISNTDYHILPIDYSPDGTVLAVGKWNGHIQILDVQTGRLLKDVASGNGPINWVRYSMDGSRLRVYSENVFTDWICE
jgi:WD40 repeat protein